MATEQVHRDGVLGAERVLEVCALVVLIVGVDRRQHRHQAHDLVGDPARPVTTVRSVRRHEVGAKVSSRGHDAADGPVARAALGHPLEVTAKLCQRRDSVALQRTFEQIDDGRRGSGNRRGPATRPGIGCERPIELFLQPATATRAGRSDVLQRRGFADLARAAARFARDEQGRRLVLPVANIDAGQLVEKELRRQPA